MIYQNKPNVVVFSLDTNKSIDEEQETIKQKTGLDSKAVQIRTECDGEYDDVTGYVCIYESDAELKKIKELTADFKCGNILLLNEHRHAYTYDLETSNEVYEGVLVPATEHEARMNGVFILDEDNGQYYICVKR